MIFIKVWQIGLSGRRGRRRSVGETFDGKRFKQIYRPKVQSEIRFYDPHTKRYVKNIYQKVNKSGKIQGAFQIGDVRLGYGVNGTHANDASVVRQFHLGGEEKGLIRQLFMTLSSLRSR